MEYKGKGKHDYSVDTKSNRRRTALTCYRTYISYQFNPDKRETMKITYKRDKSEVSYALTRNGEFLKSVKVLICCHFRTSNVIRPTWHEDLLFQGWGPLFLLFVYCFLSQFCELFRPVLIVPYHTIFLHRILSVITQG